MNTPAPAWRGKTLPVARPRLPPAHAILPYLRQIDRNAWYSNHGPLAQALQARLAAHWGVARTELTLLCNGTSALTLTLQACGAKPGQRCLMPSWTFIASAGAVHQAGLVPHFVDVSAATWMADPAEIRRLAPLHDVGAILVDSPFGAPIDMAAWEAVQADTGIPVIIDGAAAFDTLRVGGPMVAGACPVIVSLHATKVFGVGEGGALLCRDQVLMEQVRRLAQFGFLGSREALLPGINAKLSEYGAAVGLASLDTWPETRARWLVATGRYCAALPGGLSPSPSFGAGWVGSTLNVLWPATRSDHVPSMSGAGVETLRWWGRGCHAHLAYRSCPAEALPVTEDLASRAIGLPFWQDMTQMQIETVCRIAAACSGLATATLAMEAA